MLAAIRAVGRHKPSKIVLAVPTASASTIKLLVPQADSIVCPNIRSVYRFALQMLAENGTIWTDLWWWICSGLTD